MTSSQVTTTYDTRHNQKIAFYRDVPEILHRLKEGDVTIAACSRTHAPDLYVSRAQHLGAAVCSSELTTICKVHDVH